MKRRQMNWAVDEAALFELNEAEIEESLSFSLVQQPTMVGISAMGDIGGGSRTETDGEMFNSSRPTASNQPLPPQSSLLPPLRPAAEAITTMGNSNVDSNLVDSDNSSEQARQETVKVPTDTLVLNDEDEHNDESGDEYREERMTQKYLRPFPQLSSSTPSSSPANDPSSSSPLCSIAASNNGRECFNRAILVSQALHSCGEAVTHGKTVEKKKNREGEEGAEGDPGCEREPFETTSKISTSPVTSTSPMKGDFVVSIQAVSASTTTPPKKGDAVVILAGDKTYMGEASSDNTTTTPHRRPIVVLPARASLPQISSSLLLAKDSPLPRGTQAFVNHHHHRLQLASQQQQQQRTEESRGRRKTETQQLKDDDDGPLPTQIIPSRYARSHPSREGIRFSHENKRSRDKEGESVRGAGHPPTPLSTAHAKYGSSESRNTEEVATENNTTATTLRASTESDKITSPAAHEQEDSTTTASFHSAHCTATAQKRPRSQKSEEREGKICEHDGHEEEDGDGAASAAVVCPLLGEKTTVLSESNNNNNNKEITATTHISQGITTHSPPLTKQRRRELKEVVNAAAVAVATPPVEVITNTKIGDVTATDDNSLPNADTETERTTKGEQSDRKARRDTEEKQSAALVVLRHSSPTIDEGRRNDDIPLASIVLHGHEADDKEEDPSLKNIACNIPPQHPFVPLPSSHHSSLENPTTAPFPSSSPSQTHPPFPTPTAFPQHAGNNSNTACTLPAAVSPPHVAVVDIISQLLESVEDLFYVADTDPRVPMWCPWRSVRDVPRGLKGWGLPNAVCDAYRTLGGGGGGEKNVDNAIDDGAADDEKHSGDENEDDANHDDGDIELYPWQRACLYDYFSNLQKREDATYGLTLIGSEGSTHASSSTTDDAHRKGKSIRITALLKDIKAIVASQKCGGGEEKGEGEARRGREASALSSSKRSVSKTARHAANVSNTTSSSATAAAAAAETSCNMLYSAPTGGGKTLVAEIVMLRCCLGVTAGSTRNFLTTSAASSSAAAKNGLESESGSAPTTTRKKATHRPIVFAADIIQFCDHLLKSFLGDQKDSSPMITSLQALITRHKVSSKPLPILQSNQSLMDGEGGGGGGPLPSQQQKVMFIVPYVALAEEKAEVFSHLIDAYNASLGDTGREARRHAEEGEWVEDMLGITALVDGGEDDDDDDDDDAHDEMGREEQQKLESKQIASIMSMIPLFALREAWLTCRTAELARRLSHLSVPIPTASKSGFLSKSDDDDDDEDESSSSASGEEDEDTVNGNGDARMGLASDRSVTLPAHLRHNNTAAVSHTTTTMTVMTSISHFTRRYRALQQRFDHLARLMLMHSGKSDPSSAGGYGGGNSNSFGVRKDKTHGTTGPSSIMAPLLAMTMAKRVQCHAGSKGHRSLSHDVLVCTIEKANVLLNLLIERNRAHELSCVVVDEVHQIREEGRGYVLELLLTKLVALSATTLTTTPSQAMDGASAPSVSPKRKSKSNSRSVGAVGGGTSNNLVHSSASSSAMGNIIVPPSQTLKVVGMSATLSNAPTLCQWMKEALLFVTDFRPVPLLEHYVVQGAVYGRLGASATTRTNNDTKDPTNAAANNNKSRNPTTTATGNSPSNASPYGLVRCFPSFLNEPPPPKPTAPLSNVWAQQSLMMDKDLQMLCCEGAVGGHQVLVFCPSRAMCETGAEVIVNGAGRLMNWIALLPSQLRPRRGIDALAPTPSTATTAMPSTTKDGPPPLPPSSPHDIITARPKPHHSITRLTKARRLLLKHVLEIPGNVNGAAGVKLSSLMRMATANTTNNTNATHRGPIGGNNQQQPQRQQHAEGDAHHQAPPAHDPTVSIIAFGVAFHHAALTGDERRVIEKAYREGILWCLCCTTTLATGVNLPTRRVIFRSIKVGDQLLDAGQYRQAAGRAGRKGLDTLGESYVLCRPAERSHVEHLLAASLPPIVSNFSLERRGMVRVLLEGIATGAIRNVFDVQKSIDGTLLSASLLLANPNVKIPSSSATTTEGGSKPAPPSEVVFATARSALEFLEANQFIEWKSEDNMFIATALGEATVASSMAPDEAILLFRDLAKARRCLCLDHNAEDLQLLYLCTPYFHGVEPNWSKYHSEHYLRIPQDVRRNVCGPLLGIEEGLLFQWAMVPPRHGAAGSNSSMYGGGAKGNPPLATAAANATRAASDLSVLNYKRFYVALILWDVIREVPPAVICKKFPPLSRAELNRLTDLASTFAAMSSSFTSSLGWWFFPPLFDTMAARLSVGVEPDLLPLMKIDGLSAKRARELAKKGYRTPLAIACATPRELEAILSKRAPFAVTTSSSSTNATNDGTATATTSANALNKHMQIGQKRGREGAVGQQGGEGAADDSPQLAKNLEDEAVTLVVNMPPAVTTSDTKTGGAVNGTSAIAQQTAATSPTTTRFYQVDTRLLAIRIIEAAKAAVQLEAQEVSDTAAEAGIVVRVPQISTTAMVSSSTTTRQDKSKIVGGGGVVSPAISWPAASSSSHSSRGVSTVVSPSLAGLPPHPSASSHHQNAIAMASGSSSSLAATSVSWTAVDCRDALQWRIFSLCLEAILLQSDGAKERRMIETTCKHQRSGCWVGLHLDTSSAALSGLVMSIRSEDTPSSIARTHTFLLTHINGKTPTAAAARHSDRGDVNDDDSNNVDGDNILSKAKGDDGGECHTGTENNRGLQATHTLQRANTIALLQSLIHSLILSNPSVTLCLHDAKKALHEWRRCGLLAPDPNPLLHAVTKASSAATVGESIKTTSSTTLAGRFKCKLFDTLIADWLLEPEDRAGGRKVTLDELCKFHAIDWGGRHQRQSTPPTGAATITVASTRSTIAFVSPAVSSVGSKSAADGWRSSSSGHAPHDGDGDGTAGYKRVALPSTADAKQALVESATDDKRAANVNLANIVCQIIAPFISSSSAAAACSDALNVAHVVEREGQKGEKDGTTPIIIPQTTAAVLKHIMEGVNEAIIATTSKKSGCEGGVLVPTKTSPTTSISPPTTSAALKSIDRRAQKQQSIMLRQKVATGVKLCCAAKTLTVKICQYDQEDQKKNKNAMESDNSGDDSGEEDDNAPPEISADGKTLAIINTKSSSSTSALDSARTTTSLLDYFHRIEMKMVLVLVAMESNGIGFDPNRYEWLLGKMKQRSRELTREAYIATGHSNWDLSNVQQCASMLFDVMKMPCLERTFDSKYLPKRLLGSAARGRGRGAKIAKESRSTKASVLNGLVKLFPEARLPLIIKEFRTMEGWAEKYLRPLLWCWQVQQSSVGGNQLSLSNNDANQQQHNAKTCNARDNEGERPAECDKAENGNAFLSATSLTTRGIAAAVAPPQHHHDPPNSALPPPPPSLVVGRVHGEFVQTATATGRLSMNDPNLQTIPHPIAFTLDDGEVVDVKLRQAYVAQHLARRRRKTGGAAAAEKGEGGVPTENSHEGGGDDDVDDPWVLVSADYAQIEARLLAHFSNDPKLLGAFSTEKEEEAALLKKNKKSLNRQTSEGNAEGDNTEPRVVEDSGEHVHDVFEKLAMNIFCPHHHQHHQANQKQKKQGHAEANTTAAMIPIITPEQRKAAKTLCYGMLYGKGAAAIADDVEVSMDEATKLLADFKACYSVATQFIEALGTRTSRKGYVSTILGRRRWLPYAGSRNPRHKAASDRIAINTLCQGSAADIIKIAMVRLMCGDDEEEGERHNLNDEVNGDSGKGADDNDESCQRPSSPPPPIDVASLSLSGAIRYLFIGGWIVSRKQHEGGVGDGHFTGGDGRCGHYCLLPRARLLLQIHDELVFEVRRSDLPLLTAVVMTVMDVSSGLQLRVPLPVRVKAGPNWADMVPVEVNDVSLLNKMKEWKK